MNTTTSCPSLCTRLPPPCKRPFQRRLGPQPPCSRHRVSRRLSTSLPYSSMIWPVPDDVILVLDDYHCIHNREVHALLELLVEHLPPQLHLVLISRSNPPLPIVRWLAKGYLTELRGSDLRFTLEETESFLTRMLGSEAARETSGAL